ncbi:MAG: S8 family serine peptidase, partial [Bacteroidota bacterium]
MELAKPFFLAFPTPFQHDTCMKKLITLACFILSFLAAANAQKHVPGDLLVQMQPGSDPYNLIAKMQSWRGVPTRLEVVEEVSKPFRIWLLHFDFQAIDENQFLAEIRRQPEVQVAQFNHLIELRETVPNDPNFGQQWQWVNTGQTGGTPDADVDADLAWDITTGGKTAGDSVDIVVAVIEGANRNQPDLQGNLWVNSAEIADNLVDDDGNGYVDDYDGWNISSDNDNIPSSGHGTNVSGMVGAKGNNGLLVTGINWDVKIMHVVVGNTVEANVLEAYTYPYVMRKRYNETGGAQGAFIVATNSSWGTDFGQPADAPLWCAFYDSLGAVGILSCGSTANNNVNIDEVGDLPTACPSEFLLSVTATDHNDVRTFSAFGVTHVDVGAPGEDIFTISNNGTTTTSGTSFASPLTAGIIGLLYSAPCGTLHGQALADPAGTALLVRDAIFNGADVVPDLVGFTKTGGRVNAFNSLQLLLQGCGPCPKPFGVRVENLIDTAATVVWSSTDSTLSTVFQWRILGDTVWTQIDSAVSPLIFNDLK